MLAELAIRGEEFGAVDVLVLVLIIVAILVLAKRL